MKGKLIIWSLVIIACFIVVGIALACPPIPRPPEPVCPLNVTDTITVTPAQWVDETTTCPMNQTFTASRQVVDVPGHYVYGEWGAWSSWAWNHQCSNQDENNGVCQDESRGDWWNREYHRQYRTRTWVPDTYRTETFTVTFDYGKSQDPNHCHRPTGQSLDVPSWAMNEFNNQFPEHINATVVPGYWIDPVCAVPVPEPVNCAVSDWGEWSACVDGSQSRTRTIITEPANGGEACPVLIETQTCVVPPTLCTDPAANNQGQPLPCTYDMCQYNSEIRADDPLCVPPVGPCEYNPEILADDPACVPPEPPEYVCQPDEFIWVWDIEGPNGMWYHLRDLGYDGTYDAPSLIQQRYYLGCDFYPVRVWGHYVSDCDVEFNYWSQLPAGNCGGQCPLP